MNTDQLTAALSDRYRVESEIDSGGMATVYRARDLKHERTVAIKVLRPDLAEAIGADRFLKEIRTTANLSHRNILPLHDSGEAAGLLYYVMPFVEGESLRDRLDREGQLPVEDAVQIAREVAEALDYAHEKGVIHRDIKPANIMLERGHALLADFGIAQAKAGADETRLTGMGMSLGTPAYMSPEQISGEGTVDGRSDQYALACVLYEMLAGHPPFTGADIQTVMRQHLAAEAPKVTGARATAPTGVAKAIHRGLAKAPADRYRTVAEFEKALAGATLPLLARIPMGRARVVGYAVGALALVVVVWSLATRGGGVRAGGESEAEWEVDRNVVAVIPFQNRTGDPDLDLGDWLARDVENRLSRAEIGAVLPGIRVAQALEAMTPDSDPVRYVARSLGAGTVVTGFIDRKGDSLEISAFCVEAATGASLSSIEPVRGVVANQNTLVTEIQDRVAGVLAMRLDPDNPDQAIGAPPLNPEAYEEYRRGNEIQANPEDWGEAADHFLRAWALDSTYIDAAIRAYIQTRQAMILGQGDWSEQHDSVLAFLLRSQDRMTRGQRYAFNASRFVEEGDFEAALREIRDASEFYPLEFANFRGTLALPLNQVREAVDAFRLLETEGGGFRVRNWPAYFQQYADALHRLGEHEKELAVVLEGKRRFPDFPGFVEAELWARIGLRQTDQVRSMVIDIRRERGPLELRFVVQALIAQGMDELAREVLEAEVQRFATDSFYVNSSESEFWQGRYLHYLGRDEEAHALLEEALVEHPESPGVIAWVGITAAAVGDTAQALEIEALPGFSSNVRAYIWATLGNRERAVQLLEQYFLEEKHHFGRDIFSMFPLQKLRGYEPYDRLMAPK